MPSSLTSTQRAGKLMFIAMNRFKVVPGAQADFERV